MTLGQSFAITGASGYLGTALAQALGARAATLRLVSRSALPPVQYGAAKIETIVADLREPAAWATVLDGVHTVFHLSAQTNLRWAEANGAADADANVRPLAALLAAAAERPVRIVFASTATVVGLPDTVHIDETLPDRPVSVYDRHKLEAERLLAAAITSRRRGCSLRLGNVYGYGAQSRNGERSVLNFMMRRALAGQPLTLYGEGRAVRDWIHVRDVVAAFVAAAAAPDGVLDGSHYLIGTGVGHSLAEAFRAVAAEAARLTGRAVAVTEVPEPADLHPIERRSAIIDAQRFIAATGWTPRIALAAGIAEDLPNYLSDSVKLAPAQGAVT